MKIRMLEPVGGVRHWPNGYQEPFAHNPGEVVDLAPALAQAWIARGTAEAIRAPRRKKP